MKLAIHHFESTDSTNVLCEHYINEGAGEGTVILADRQTAAKGRHGRKWMAPLGNLYTSFILTPSVHDNAPLIKDYDQLAFVAGVGVYKGLTSLGVENIQLKWPNDGLVDGKKLFGILVECVGDAVIVGIGVNVNIAPEGLDQEITCIKALMTNNNDDHDVADVFHAVLKCFWQTYREWLANGFDGIRGEWLSRAHGFNEGMTRGECTGIFTGISDEGALLLTADDGVMHRIITV